MSARTLVAATLGLMAILTLALAVLVVLTLGVSIPAVYGLRGMALPYALVTGAVGGAIALRWPRNAVGWLFIGQGYAAVLYEGAQTYAAYAVLVRGGALPGAEWAGWVASWMWVFQQVPAATLLVLLFPDGRLPGRRWWPAAAYAVLAMIVLAASAAIVAGPLARAPYLDTPLHLGGLALAAEVMRPISIVAIGSPFVSVAGLVVRYRRAGPVPRQQIKWFVFGEVIFVVATGFLPVYGETAWFKALHGLLTLAVPVTAGVAILRHRLFDIDLLIRGTVVYGTTTAALGAAFFTAIVLLQRPLGALTGGSELAVVFSTVACYALFQPVRGRIQRAVDRRFYRTRHDADRTLDDLRVRLRDQVALDAVREDVLAVVREVMEPERAFIWLRAASSASRTFRNVRGTPDQ